jgi:hypothetical protein
MNTSPIAPGEQPDASEQPQDTNTLEDAKARNRRESGPDIQGFEVTKMTDHASTLDMNPPLDGEGPGVDNLQSLPDAGTEVAAVVGGGAYVAGRHMGRRRDELDIGSDPTAGYLGGDIAHGTKDASDALPGGDQGDDQVVADTESKSTATLDVTEQPQATNTAHKHLAGVKYEETVATTADVNTELKPTGTLSNVRQTARQMWQTLLRNIRG